MARPQNYRLGYKLFFCCFFLKKRKNKVCVNSYSSGNLTLPLLTQLLKTITQHSQFLESPINALDREVKLVHL